MYIVSLLYKSRFVHNNEKYESTVKNNNYNIDMTDGRRWRWHWLWQRCQQRRRQRR